MNTTATITREANRQTAICVAKIICDQVGPMTFATLGSSNLTPVHSTDASPTGVQLPGLRFEAGILPFNADGSRSLAARRMFITISLNSSDLYNVSVKYTRRGSLDLRTHFETVDVPVEMLIPLLVALDYDGAETLNPRIMA